jgi:hypothetical protein
METRMPRTHGGYATASAIVFTLVALFQVYRAAVALPVQIGGTSIPVAASWGIAAFAALMAFWGWRSR